MPSLVSELLVNIAHIGKISEGEFRTRADSNGRHVLRWPWKVRKDEKALAARPGVDDSLCDVAAGTAIVVFYWLYWTAGDCLQNKPDCKIQVSHKGSKLASPWGYGGIDRQLRDRLR
jgi:hypothetical protein